jgi:hypothetical protein
VAGCQEDPQVHISQLKDTFEQRMNPPVSFPISFDRVQSELNRSMADVIPSVTVDCTAEHHFSAPLSMEDIEWAKLHIKKQPPNSACGQNHVSYSAIEDIPNEDLLVLFQRCIDSGEAPGAWLSSNKLYSWDY